MRPTVLATFVLISLAACGDSSPSPDAAAIRDGATTSDGAAATDAAIDAAGATCTGAVYDPCTMPNQCQSGICHAFNGSGLQVCTPSCTPGSACPAQNGVPITCNNMGFCKPPAANACTR